MNCRIAGVNYNAALKRGHFGLSIAFSHLELRDFYGRVQGVRRGRAKGDVHYFNVRVQDCV